ncbi:MAG: type I restriction endonuclease subunit R [Deltaproteobacteria bacterium]|jgi:type I restriction enzyme R subunit|nr:type I restriction endonuclease subunit R [Deltaproteobacteria bacterium]
MSYNIIIQTDEETVVSEYTPIKDKSGSYQSEYELEQDFIAHLTEQGYQYLNINNETDLKQNLREQLERLNGLTFSKNEWEHFFKEVISNQNEGIVEKTKKIQEDFVQLLRRDDGTTKNIRLINKKEIHENSLQVINQYEQTGTRQNRYDVTILVNGLPLVHVELKRRGVALKEAFNQIKRYQRDSFWAGASLFDYVQLFVISNGTETKYYSNTTRESHIKEQDAGGRSKSKKTSNSFEFTSYWADANNNRIPDLVDFTKTFFSKHTLLAILTRYCVFTTENILIVMRPYQIAATERILNRIKISSSYDKKLGTTEAGGYIWHTTGSGKTLTSFKASQLACELQTKVPIDKVIFVVDRRDLDYQTMKEYDKFEKGAANSNTSTNKLRKQLEDPNAKIIVTTIQKLDRFITHNVNHEIYKSHLVLIFDECHRSQFGQMRANIVKSFKKYHIFGFTGTPIFVANAKGKGDVDLTTTDQIFGDKLHTYTVVNAIDDQNVLPFRVEFLNTIKRPDDESKVNVNNYKAALGAPQRIKLVAEYILEHFDQKTSRNSSYSIQGKRQYGFNSIFAVSSIDMAKKFYSELMRQIQENSKDLKIGIIFSYSANEDDPEEGILEEGLDPDNLDKLDKTSQEFLDNAISNYNRMFNTSFSTKGDNFQNYYKDISDRVKKRELDLLIVVNMFLTGFDATTLNTLWVDKNLSSHGLMQAFSRTNRILNSVKTFGNIVCFRDIKKEMDVALALFGNKDAGGILLLRPYNDYYYGYNDKNGNHVNGYQELIDDLKNQFPLNSPILGEQNEKDFINLYGSILRLKNILHAFDEFRGNEILSEREFQDYQSRYLDLYDKFSGKHEKCTQTVHDDIIFEIELIKHVEVTIDYILLLVARYHQGHCEDKEILETIQKAVDSSTQLRRIKYLIEKFIEIIDPVQDVDFQWEMFIKENFEKDISAIIKQENLKDKETHQFIENSIQDGNLRMTGTEIDSLLPPVSRFSEDANRAAMKERVIDKLKLFFDKFFGLLS